MQGSAEEPKAKIGAAWREAAFIFIFATVLLDMLAIGVVIPVLPKLVVDFVGGDTQEAAKIFGVFGTAGPDAFLLAAARRAVRQFRGGAR